MGTQFVSSTDGNKLQVNDFIKQPKLVSKLVTNMLHQAFIGDTLLRDAGQTTSGMYVVERDASMFADGLEVIEEYGEIPVVHGEQGDKQAVFTVKGGGALVISKEMRTRNDIDAVNKRLRQIKNGMVRFWDRRVWAALDAAGLSTFAADKAWSDPTAKIRYHIAKGMEAVQTATNVAGEELGLNPDTIIVHTSRKSQWIYNDDITKVYVGSLAGDNPIYVGDTGREVMGLRVLTTPHITPSKSLICERKTLGFIGDEASLDTTALYEQRERQAHRSDTTRSSAIGIDQPEAGCYVLGV